MWCLPRVAATMFYLQASGVKLNPRVGSKMLYDYYKTEKDGNQEQVPLTLAN